MNSRPSQLTLAELIARLREEPDQSKRLKLGFTHPHSYRGFYEQVAFEPAENVTVAEMLADATSALGATFHSWKGGDYLMRPYTETWIAEQGCEGETLGVLLLSLLLADVARGHVH